MCLDVSLIIIIIRIDMRKRCIRLVVANIIILD